jgi:hypothetical protein
VAACPRCQAALAADAPWCPRCLYDVDPTFRPRRRMVAPAPDQPVPYWAAHLGGRPLEPRRRGPRLPAPPSLVYLGVMTVVMGFVCYGVWRVLLVADVFFNSLG